MLTNTWPTKSAAKSATNDPVSTNQKNGKAQRPESAAPSSNSGRRPTRSDSAAKKTSTGMSMAELSRIATSTATRDSAMVSGFVAYAARNEICT